jgi:hypothetical protein
MAEDGPPGSYSAVSSLRCHMFLILITFILTTALYAALFWLATRNLARHLQDNPEAIHALSKHLFVPLLGKRAKEDDLPGPVVQATLSPSPQSPVPSGSSQAPKRT